MASGIPVIAADWGGPSDYIDVNSGILIAPATPDKFVNQLANAMLSLSKNPQRRKEFGKAGRRRVKELYDWRFKAKAMLQIYEDVLSAAQGATARKPRRIGRSLPSPPRPAHPVHAETTNDE